ncbi:MULTISPECIES: hypothetical protein [Pseudomonadota]|jgi:hypothetical protein|uniref:Uncharacterized protein n=1 Tax=Sphingomonas ursincola TaxID=56361 RepID=A0A7V8U8J3_9SPHN|nr:MULTISPECIES: hypothetical protein [Pseudomonadota]MAF60392.1 hypothetical protein [Blastomonas sp.]OHC97185.1 MAG: hypothetical protein A2792_14930 [Sphingomonadales bacterium RIFCSPHIGHO2_01_FULL_65_20]MBA1374497.1 hypothetical protein [Sphingomonas ursincola]MBA4780548.1 hypothetical protein [Blastomonas sp.]MBY0619719.1 hypothetical protein [Sphingomonas ursincola]|tara:strand:+ start:49406 stop:49609 length:204 start_codon:yes stop_codon:yes gene_type:complete
MQRLQFLRTPAQPHSFRSALSPRVLAATPVDEPEVLAKRKRAQRNEEIRLFFLSFTAFFVAISSFIW